ncbi:hypothetical protein AQ914_02450 [Burkholderia pseudomallei]|nr:hypothetical protein AQ914_02450 [Burkholderia pseudomallei]
MRRRYETLARFVRDSAARCGKRAWSAAMLRIPFGFRAGAAQGAHVPVSLVEYFKRRSSLKFRENPSIVLSKPN